MTLPRSHDGHGMMVSSRLLVPYKIDAKRGDRSLPAVLRLYGPKGKRHDDLSALIDL